MDMRDYDPAIGRWTGIDPVTHFPQSPYNAFDGNPVTFADPSGADGVVPDIGGTIYGMAGQSVSVNYGGPMGGHTRVWMGAHSEYEMSWDGHENANAGSNIHSVEVNGCVYLPEVTVGGNSNGWASAIEQHVYKNSPFYNNGIQNGDLSGLSLALGGGALSAGESVMFNKSSWFSLKQMRAYSQKFNGNGSTGGKFTSAKRVSSILSWAGYALGVYGANSINNQFISGEINTSQMLMEQSVNAYSTVGGLYGAAAGIGWESGRTITTLDAYQNWKQNSWLPFRQAIFGY
jgi:hypothetical protein